MKQRTSLHDSYSGISWTEPGGAADLNRNSSLVGTWRLPSYDRQLSEEPSP